jgi:hypothetical protein
MSTSHTPATVLPPVAVSTTGINITERTNSKAGYSVTAVASMNLSIPVGTKWIRVLCSVATQPVMLNLEPDAATSVNLKQVGASSVGSGFDHVFQVEVDSSSGGYPRLNAAGQPTISGTQKVFVWFYA